MSEIDTLSQYLDCKTNCEYGVSSQKAACMAQCPSFDTKWEKNGVNPVDKVDLELALLEYWDRGTLTKVCYQDGWVKPVGTCGSSDCLATHTTAECADSDGDGLKEWQEKLFGTKDSEKNTACATNAQCNFQTNCIWNVLVGESRCVARTGCSGSACTAYHLEIVEQNNSQVVARVHYDYSPIPARVLDLYISYSADALSLLDARLLKPVLEAGKELQTKFTNDGQLRLIVLGSGSMKTIPFGPVVELVFSRISDQQTSIGFVKSDSAQQMSQAPSNDLVQSELKNDALWGSDVSIKARSQSGPRLLLYYPFDELNEPLAYSDVRDAVEMCALDASCSGLKESDSTQRAMKVKRQAQLETVQRGWSKVSEVIPGVRDRGAYFAGREDHLQLPIIAEPAGSRSYTLETWFYAESEIAETAKVSQLLFNQQTTSETTQFGVGLKRSATARSVDLVWFEGNADAEPGPSPLTIATVSVLDWNYLTMTVDEASGRVRFYLNGEEKNVSPVLSSGALTSCPMPSGSGFSFHKEGDFLTGQRPPEAVFYASTQNNLYGIERMDPNGFARGEVIREGTSQTMDPDFSPVTGKLVYVSSETGDFEIWIANEDGSQARPITRGFGDTSRGIFARRPRWAPNGTGIVFESNAYSVEGNHNWYGRTYQLYYLAYNVEKDEVAIADPNGGIAPLSMLDYNSFLEGNNLFKVTLTSDSAHNHYGVVWLSGSHSNANPPDLGRIAFTQASEDYDDRVIRVGTILSPEKLNQADQPLDVPYVTNSSDGKGAELLDASVNVKAGTTSYLVARTEVAYETTNQFKVQSVVASGQGVDVRLVFEPSGYSTNCWDTDQDGKCHSELEDLNKIGGCDITDCYPSQIGDLYLEYPYAKVRFNPNASRVNAVLVDPSGLNKDVELSEAFTAYGDFVKIKVMSPLSSRPLPAGLVATLRFERVGSSTTSASDYKVKKRTQRRDLVLGQGGNLAPVSIPRLSDVFEGRFSPDGGKLIVAGLENARPVVALYDASQPDGQKVTKVSLVPQRVEGMDWNVGERFAPCQFVGGTRNPSSKLLKRQFRGGLDEMRLYSYARTGEAIRSEFERGKRWLDKAGAAANPKARVVTCDKHRDCPDYQLCGGNGTTDPKGLCATVPCKNGDCPGGGACTLLPVPLGGGEEALRLVCSAECSSDTECFEQDCLNGQCRFCDNGAGGTSACLECRLAPVKIPGVETFLEVQGCPDRNSFLCEDGSCYSECYAQENGQSRYLCQPGVEYCNQGRCVAIKWSWDDLSPSTMSGLAQMTMSVQNAWTTTAIAQTYPVTIRAYGVEDYLKAPQVIVEGRVASDASGLPMYYGTDWFEVGVVRVYNKDKIEAELNPYTVLSPYPMEEVRLRLISPPLENGNQGNHGLMNGEKHFCSNWATDPSKCLNRVTGSRATIGYRVGIPRVESRRACAENGYDNAICKYQQDDLRPYLWGGQPAVVVLGVTVKGKNVMTGKWTNLACGYASKTGEVTTMATRPVPGRGYLQQMKRPVFGSLTTELSGQSAGGLLKNMVGPMALVDGKAMVGDSWALLNCTLAEPVNPKAETRVAGATFRVCTDFESCRGDTGGLYRPTGDVGTISETNNGCFIKVGMRSKPCYDWVGGDATLDYLSAEQDQLFSTLDFDTFRGHGH
ncbi:MAG: hypothetical protein MUC50_04095 [Myxococcota bacterium]|nr:hypothetical protein [Myxococcota bacterium]